MKAGAGRGKETVTTMVDGDSDLVNDDRAVLAAPFACIPLWVLEADISSAAKLLYAGLNSFVAGKGGACTVRRRTLSARMGLSVATIGRALKDLVRIGALVVKERQGEDGSRLANEYILLFDSPAVREEAARVTGRVPESLVLGDPVEAPAPAVGPIEEAPEAPPEPAQKPRSEPVKSSVSNPLFLEFKDVYGRVKPAEGAAVEKAWLRVVQDRDPREMRAKAEKLLEKTRDYVELRMREKDSVARVKFTKSPVNFLSDGFWETVPPAPPEPAQPEVGKVYFDEGPRVPLSEQDVYPSWKAAAEGDEATIKAAKRRMRAGVTVPDAAVVQYPVLIDIFGLECDKYAPEEVRAVFRGLGKPVPGEEPATGADDEVADGGGSLFAELGASMKADMGPAGLEADPADGMSTYDADRFLT
jgi:hypothetical protein